MELGYMARVPEYQQATKKSGSLCLIWGGRPGRAYRVTQPGLPNEPIVSNVSGTPNQGFTNPG